MIDFTELPSDGVRFEQFVRELLVRSGFEVHWTGVGPDGGRDLVVVEKALGQLASFERKWLVSCKHNASSGKSVGLDDVSDITDACAAVEATGFLLACSTQPSSTVVRRFEEIEARGNLVVRYWDGVELEKRLNTPQAFALNHLFFPQSSKSNQWLIHATVSPSLWVANYTDYFMYLSSRDAHTYPNLSHVEAIIRRLEGVALPPAGNAWDRHYLRPRAVYFDNKHQQFTVFVDYLYAHKHAHKPLAPRILNRTLDDGSPLYLEDGAGSYLTYWDVKYVASSQISDHFHLDHKDYYEPFMELFRSGFPRCGLLGEWLSVEPFMEEG